MKKLVLLPAVLVALLVSLVSSRGGELNLDFTIVNKTGYEIKEIYIDEATENNWTDNVMKGQGNLKEDETFKVEFSPEEDSAKWDIKAVYADGETAIWTGLKLTDITTVTLFWSKDKGSSAKVE